MYNEEKYLDTFAQKKKYNNWEHLCSENDPNTIHGYTVSVLKNLDVPIIGDTICHITERSTCPFFIDNANSCKDCKYFRWIDFNEKI